MVSIYNVNWSLLIKFKVIVYWGYKDDIGAKCANEEIL
jgi:hypothetical protein